MTVTDGQLDEYLAELMRGMDTATLDNFRKPDRWMLKQSMRLCGMSRLPAPIGDGDRVSGDMVCPRCKRTYRDHPADWRKIGYGDMPFLNILCDGQLVKL